MSLAASLGPQSLVQLGLSISDVALLYNAGNKFGNWLFATRNDNDLFESLGEIKEALLKRRGIVDRARMQSMYRHTQFHLHGHLVNSAYQNVEAQQQCDFELDELAWLMAVVVTTLDLCMRPEAIKTLLIDVFIEVLGDPEAANALRVNIDKNLESWRQVGSVRGISIPVKTCFRKTWTQKSGVGAQAIPELNPAETDELAKLLVVMFKGEAHSFECISAVIFSVFRAIQKSGIDISTDDEALYPGQFHITYMPGSIRARQFQSTEDRKATGRPVMRQTIMISYPARFPESMIQVTDTERATINDMEAMWKRGSEAAAPFFLQAKADLPCAHQNEFYYELEGDDVPKSRFKPHITMLSNKAFPVPSQQILLALENLLHGASEEDVGWLGQYIGLEYLIRDQTTAPEGTKTQFHLWFKYQALVFGFYYKLLEPLVDLNFLSRPLSEVYFRGVWGTGSTTFLAMCTQFGDELYRKQRVGRTHVTYMLATMYGGRQKVYSAENARKNLLGVIGPITILARPLVKVSDCPQDLARYAVLDLPEVQLMGTEDGELYAGTGCGIQFKIPKPSGKPVIRSGPSEKWSVHSSMSEMFRDVGGQRGVVMAAHCGGRLVGWFSPVVAETIFLSSAYQGNREGEDMNVGDLLQEIFLPDDCFEVTDEDWESGCVPLPGLAGDSFGIVQSRQCPELRYAAAGFYGNMGEIAIATNDVSAAIGRVEAQEGGIIIM